MSSPVEGCLACDLASGRQPLPGGVIHETDGWQVEHCVGPLGVGTLLVKPMRHVTRVSELTEAEAGELSPMLQMAIFENEAPPPAALVESFADRARAAFATAPQRTPSRSNAREQAVPNFW